MKMGILGVLGVVFVTLKLVGTIDWSWWLVLLPFYGGLLFALAILVLATGGACIAALAAFCKFRRK